MKYHIFCNVCRFGRILFLGWKNESCGYYLSSGNKALVTYKRVRVNGRGSWEEAGSGQGRQWAGQADGKSIYVEMGGCPIYTHFVGAA